MLPLGEGFMVTALFFGLPPPIPSSPEGQERPTPLSLFSSLSEDKIRKDEERGGFSFFPPPDEKLYPTRCPYAGS